jgi:hypothetical protein
MGYWIGKLTWSCCTWEMSRFGAQDWRKNPEPDGQIFKNGAIRKRSS